MDGFDFLSRYLGKWYQYLDEIISDKHIFAQCITFWLMMPNKKNFTRKRNSFWPNICDIESIFRSMWNAKTNNIGTQKEMFACETVSNMTYLPYTWLVDIIYGHIHLTLSRNRIITKEKVHFRDWIRVLGGILNFFTSLKQKYM